MISPTTCITFHTSNICIILRHHITLALCLLGSFVFNQVTGEITLKNLATNETIVMNHVFSPFFVNQINLNTSSVDEGYPIINIHQKVFGFDPCDASTFSKKLDFGNRSSSTRSADGKWIALLESSNLWDLCGSSCPHGTFYVHDLARIAQQIGASGLIYFHRAYVLEYICWAADIYFHFDVA